MAGSIQSSLYDIVVEKYKRGEVKIEVNKAYSLVTYSQFSKNPLVKLFHLFVKIYTYPFVIVGVIIASLFLPRFEDRYYFILGYLIGLFFFIYLESYLQEKVAISGALNDREVFDELNRRGVIKIIETPSKE
ncbi:MAG: hypothetical protein NT072_06210 [Deltaproteobacteria bacterium]|nr:hypothetical protein [Deltaproteobacteria bacterium]